MFLLDLSNILIIFFVAVSFAAYIFILRRLRPEIATLKDIAQESPNKTDNKKKEETKDSGKTTREKPSFRTGLSCLHEFGYLGTLPKNSKIPDECLGCSRIMTCLAEGRSRDREVNVRASVFSSQKSAPPARPPARPSARPPSRKAM